MIGGVVCFVADVGDPGERVFAAAFPARYAVGCVEILG